jgi:hypothetical protein
MKSSTYGDSSGMPATPEKALCGSVSAKAAQDDAYVCGRVDEQKRWEDALRRTWRLINPMRPAGPPGSYARGFDSGVSTALETLIANLTPNTN